MDERDYKAMNKHENGNKVSADVSNRIILNVDSVGIHMRTNECTIHHGENGEVEYHCKPIKSVYGWFWIFLIKLVIKYGC